MKSPPSPMTTASRSSRFASSPYTRSGWIGSASDSRSTRSCASAACSFSRSWARNASRSGRRWSPGAGGHGTHAGLARELGVRLGGVAGGLLMAVVDDVDSLLDAAVVEREEVPATEREQVAHAQSAEGLRREPAGVEREALISGAARPVLGDLLPMELPGCGAPGHCLGALRRCLLRLTLVGACPCERAAPPTRARCQSAIGHRCPLSGSSRRMAVGRPCRR